jgi:hypothetical protein
MSSIIYQKAHANGWTCSGRRQSTSKSQSTSEKDSARNSNGDLDSQASSVHLEYKDYQNICSYLEQSKHYTDIFGSSSKTTIGGGPKVTRARAWDRFADYMNVTNRQLSLNGRKLQQRFSTYKEKFCRAKKFSNNTGAGILEGDGYETLEQKLEAMCPCFDWMDAIFGAKANVIPFALHDTTEPLDNIAEIPANPDRANDEGFPVLMSEESFSEDTPINTPRLASAQSPQTNLPAGRNNLLDDSLIKNVGRLLAALRGEEPQPGQQNDGATSRSHHHSALVDSDPDKRLPPPLDLRDSLTPTPERQSTAPQSQSTQDTAASSDDD